MSDFLKSVLERIQETKTIALPEATDPRMLEAARRVTSEGWAKIVFVGNGDEISKVAKQEGADIDGIPIVNPEASSDMEAFCQEYWNLRGKGKPYDEGKAKKFMVDPLFYAAMMARKEQVDGIVAGAVNTTANVLRAGIFIIQTAEGVNTVSSAFVMEHPDKRFGHEGKMIYADCAVIPEPTQDQLVDIAIASAKTARALVGCEPRIAFLSFSTKGSASHPMIDRVRAACEATKQRAPELAVDGEMQFDAAVVQGVGERKAPGSDVAGRANIMIFPDLDAGNIGYKITERLGGANAFGPFLQGLSKPINDLSRGCDADDIVTSVAVTALQAQS